ncbi:MAG: HlyC/CorC family transporter [Deltaproteobacteria bacterium]|nr:HlyC/CorC family transporter [Deltaproteobacteria bacterium]MBW2413435.1 HlyC/CorC family transporter [Deltaproteobacteria bacterium]
MDPVYYVGLIFVCLVASAFFSSSETALLRLRSQDIEKDVSDGRGPAAAAVRELLQSTSRLLVTILLGNNVVNILGSAAAAALAIHYLGAERGIIVATVVMTVLVLVCAEVLPKAIAARHPRRVAYAFGLPLYILHALLRPLHWLFDRAIEPVVRRIAGGSEAQTQTAEEVLRLARLASVSSPDSTPLGIIGSAAGAADRTVEEIMVPRTEIVAFKSDTPPDELLEKVLEERFTRVPIYEQDIDEILGVVHLKDLINLVRSGRDGGLHGVLKPVLRVPERKLVLRLLADMQRAFVHVAIVKDEFGVTQGLVTQEDILEEIVGEIRDEFDREELLAIRPTGDGSFESLGRVSVLDFNRESGWEVPAEPGDTLSGLVFNALGRAPSRGDRVHVPGYALTVADVSGSRVTQVHVSRCEGDGEHADEASES